MFYEEKFNMQQIPRTELKTYQVPETKSVSRGEKLIYKFYEEKNKHATSLTSKNQHAINSMNKISFTRRKTNVQVSQKNKISI